MKNTLLTLLAVIICFTISAQIKTSYYLPDIEYDSNIPSPEEFIGHQIGEWHLSHDKLYMYLRELARVSDRVELVEYARSYEERPLIYLIITSKENHQNLAKIQADHVQLSDASNSKSLDVSNMPVVTYQGFNIHGNEASGGNAAPLYAYYLAAGQSAAVQNALDNAVVLLDPCYNPDGFNRFSTWVNMHKNKNLTSDTQDREYDEAWPRARTNHYWFDLNRDWLPVQHPESQGRIRSFHEWKPNVLTDHHEMGSNSTYFFQPGIPKRTNPITPQKNQDLTAKIGTYHAKALDAIGSFYYTQESFDDFYYGKGSTYPDANGCIGILFEQASSRGHLQETVNGNLSFPFTIRNQVTTALSTLKASLEMREELLTYQRDFYVNAQQAAKSASVKGYVFGEEKDKARLDEFLDILKQHQIKVYKLGKNLNVKGKSFNTEHSYVVPSDQQQHLLIRGIFETSTTFKDSLFYDISAWTFPLAFNIEYEELSKSDFSTSLLGQELSSAIEKRNSSPMKSNYAYLLEWEEYYAPKALNAILTAGLRAKVATERFTLNSKNYDYGTVMIPVQNQNFSADNIYNLMKIIAEETGVRITGVNTGLTPTGIDLGSPNFQKISNPQILLVVGDGVVSYDAGEVWHLLDQRYDMAISMVETRDLGNVDLARYNVIVMVDGYYNSIPNSAVDHLKEWSSNGGTIVAMKRAVQWLNAKDIANVKFKNGGNNDKEQRPYAKAGSDRGSRVIGGAIFEAEIDVTHPLFYGYKDEILPVFRRGTLFFQPANNVYATPARYTADPLLSGYIKKERLEQLKNSATIIVNGNGSGRVICLADNPNFRAFWYGTNKIFANAVFFGNIISGSTVER
ncbi:MAG: M14 metallopeptidase family protein [Bacteroidota bacterium]